MTKEYYSIRTNTNKNIKGISFEELKRGFLQIYNQIRRSSDIFGGFESSDDIVLDITLNIRKENIWPIEFHIDDYNEDDLFDIIEYLYRNFILKDYDYLEKINILLSNYKTPFELSEKGEILSKSEKGLEQIFKANIPTSDQGIRERLDSAVLKFRKYKSSIDDRRHAVRDLADVLEKLRPEIKKTGIITGKDENDLFNIANKFEIRHCKNNQKTDYDKSIWLSWMFYFYLSTIHVILRKIEKKTTT